MDIKIDVEIGDYLSRKELQDEVKYAVEEYVRCQVDDYFDTHSYRSFIERVASDVFWRCIEEMGEDTRGAIRNAVRKTILELQPYQLIGTRTNFDTGRQEPTYVQKVINEEAEKLRPEIAGLLRRTMEKAVEDDLPSVCADAVYDLLSKG